MATAESVKGKLQGLIDQSNATTGNSDADLTAAVGSLIAGFGQGGGSGGIGAVKFIDVDITVDASTTTKVDYTVDGLEFISSIENPTTPSKSFSRNDTYIAFIVPKNITGVASGTFTYIYDRGMWLGYGNTNYTPTIINILSYKKGVTTQTYGIYGLQLFCTSVSDGKKTGYLKLSVRHHTSSGYEVLAGTYNVQVYYLTDWNWGIES